MYGTILAAAQALDPNRSWSAGRARAWQAFAAWPPDVFALTSVLIEETGLHRFAASPAPGKQWPPVDDWYDQLEALADLWQGWARLDWPIGDPCPSAVAKLVQSFEPLLGTALHDLARGSDWQAVGAVLTLHHAADQACAGLAIYPQTSAYDRQANHLLKWTGSLARLPTDMVRVLPKFRTPQVGITPRSLSLHAAIDRSGLDVECLLEPDICDRRLERFNLLLLPWPLEVRPTAFHPVERPGQALAARVSNSRFFEFEPHARLPLAELKEAIRASQERIGPVHAVVLPENAVHEDELEGVYACLSELGVGVLLAGVRAHDRNFARLAVAKKQGRWHGYDQDKHHRWCLDEEQIRSYHLGAALHPAYRWWESIALSERCANLLIANGWLTICHLICEDLARAGPGADLVRAIGPSLVVALLLDGPQLAARWPGRYASVLADDPGSSVLTLTALGMAERSRPSGTAPSRTVALWKDPRTGARELELAPGATGLFLSLCVNWTEEFTADGRSDRRSAAQLVFGGVEQVRVTAPATVRRKVSTGPRKRVRKRAGAGKERS